MSSLESSAVPIDANKLASQIECTRNAERETLRADLVAATEREREREHTINTNKLSDDD